jgi:hypothetical protein
MSWIPFGYIFQTNMIELILNNFVVPNTTRIEAIKCFTEIASLDFSEMDPAEKKCAFISVSSFQRLLRSLRIEALLMNTSPLLVARLKMVLRTSVGK